MEYINHGFDVSYLIKKGSTVKTTASGSFEGVSYSSSVKIVSRNIYEVFNAKTQFFDTKEDTVVFKIVCNDDNQARELALKLRTYLKTNDLTVSGSLARYGNGEFSSTIHNSLEEIQSILNKVGAK